MKQYLDFVRHVLETGTYKSDRTGTGTLSTFGYQMRFNLAEGFPLVTTKKCHLRSIIHELLWFLKGDTNIKYLKENGVSIWDEWADENGDLGPVYGAQWRSWPAGREVVDTGIALSLQTKTIDQISNLVEQLKTNPDSRRLIVSAWNPALVDEMALPPCHALFQFYSRELTLEEREEYHRVHNGSVLAGSKNEDFRHEVLDRLGVPRRNLSCQLYQRSADIFLGVPFNIASYALLTMMVAQVVGYEPGDFIWTGGDCHLYANHLEQAKLQLTRDPHPLPKMKLNLGVSDLFAFTIDDFELTGYEHHPAIKAPVAV